MNVADIGTSDQKGWTVVTGQNFEFEIIIKPKTPNDDPIAFFFEHLNTFPRNRNPWNMSILVDGVKKGSFW